MDAVAMAGENPDLTGHPGRRIFRRGRTGTDCLRPETAPL